MQRFYGLLELRVKVVRENFKRTVSQVEARAIEGLRQLHRVDPETFTTPVLAARFRVSPEAGRRILKSRWAPPPERSAKLIKKEAEASSF
jgi:hypothetical protein